MTTSPDPWLDQLVSDDVVAPPGPPNTKARDSLMDAARTSLIDATRDPGRSPGGIIRDTENAVRQAISALAAHHGTRFVGSNKHAAAVRFAEAHPGFDNASVDKIDQIRLARNAGMYGDRHDDTPVALQRRGRSAPRQGWSECGEPGDHAAQCWAADPAAADISRMTDHALAKRRP